MLPTHEQQQIMKQKGKSYDSFYFMRDRSGWIPNSYPFPSFCVEWIIGKFNPMAKGNQLSSDRSGSISFYPVDIRCEADCYRRGKCTN